MPYLRWYVEVNQAKEMVAQKIEVCLDMESAEKLLVGNE